MGTKPLCCGGKQLNMVDEIDLNNPDVVDCYDDLSFWSAMAGQLLLRHLKLVPGVRALDVGCGTGFPALELAQRLGSKSSVTGIDVWTAALDAHIAHRTTVPGTVTLLKHAGFEPFRSSEETMLMRFSNGTAFLRHSFIRLGFVPAWRDLVPESDREAVFDRLRRALDAHAVEQHGLTLSIPVAYIEARAS